MKKMFLAVCLMVMSTAVFAADSPALKAVLKTKNYAEAEALVKSSLGEMASPAEKAKAYNHLFDIASKEFEALNNVIEENQRAVVMKTDVKEVDMVAYYNYAYNILFNALECDKYDVQPNEKGEVKPRYRKDEARLQKIMYARQQLVTAGDEARSKENVDEVLRFWGLFLDSETAPLLAEADKSYEKPFLGQVALLAGWYAEKAQKFEMAERFFDIAETDPEYKEEAQNHKLDLSMRNLKTEADSTQFINKLKERYEKTPDETTFGILCSLYYQMNKNDDFKTLVDKHLGNNPQSYLAWSYKGMLANNLALEDLDKADWEPAIEAYIKALEVAQTDEQRGKIGASLGECYVFKARGLQDRAQQRELFSKAIEVLEKVKDIDPDNEYRWARNLWVSYGSAFSFNDDRAKAIAQKFGFE